MIRAWCEGGIGRLALERPDKRNALTPPMLAQLQSEVATLSDRAGVIVLSGQGAAFCAGFDLALCREDETALGSMLRGLGAAVGALRRSDAVIVVAAHGAAVAGGCALLGGGDIVVTDARATLGYPVVRLGISPAVSAPTLRLLVGDGAARERVLDPGLIDGREAARLGLAHEVVEEPGEVLPRAMDLARELAAKPRRGLMHTKRWLNRIDGSGEAEALAPGLAASLALVGGPEQAELLPRAWARPARPS
ncbi:MAG TPA: enoyl-CoA hydratase/isomerase family protein [Phycisphaerales bacterium]|nr:enoyl-CoA hydratase/isomerase family protein [Phycisphaerales bacterium]